MSLRKSQIEVDEIINKRLEEINVSLREPYIHKNNRSKLQLICNIDNHIWDVKYFSFINKKSGCPRCAGQIIYKEEAENNVNKRLREINATLREPFTYIGAEKTRLKLKCNIDGYEWETHYSNFVNNKTGCFRCSGHVLYNYEIVDNINRILKEINATLREPYIHINNKSKLKLKCKIDNCEWESTYYNFVNSNKGCPKCANVLKLTQEEVEEKILRQCKIMNYEINKPFVYENTRTLSLEIKCNKCNHIWNVKLNNFISHKSGCPKCNTSKGENKIETILKEKNIQYETQKIFYGCIDKGFLKFDFYLPNINTCIEFDGEQHFKSFKFFGGKEKLKQNKKRDEIKNQYCLENNIDLIRIPYYEFDNIEEILKRM